MSLTVRSCVNLFVVSQTKGVVLLDILLINLIIQFNKVYEHERY